MELYVDELGVLLDSSQDGRQWNWWTLASSPWRGRLFFAIVNLLLYSLCMALVLRTENRNLNRVGFSGCVLWLSGIF